MYIYIAYYHRLRGSASPVLTATHNSYGNYASPKLSDFFRLTSGGQTPQPILTQNGSNDVNLRKDDTFAVKIATFHTPWTLISRAARRSKFCKFSDIFSLDLAFNIRGQRENTPYYPCDAMLARVIVIATCPSVCLSVRLSRAGIVSKRRKLAAWFLHHLVAPRL